MNITKKVKPRHKYMLFITICDESGRMELNRQIFCTIKDGEKEVKEFFGALLVMLKTEHKENIIFYEINKSNRFISGDWLELKSSHRGIINTF